MFVRYWMSKDVKVITKAANLSDALELMRSNKIRRLVVMDQNKLCGVIAESDLYRYADKHVMYMASVPEGIIKDLKAHKVEDVMTIDPVTCNPNSPLEDIGELMRRKKIGVLPVMEKEKLVGIITESDVLLALSELARYGSKGKRVCFSMKLEEKLNVFYKVVEMCEEYGLDVLTILTHPIENGKAHLVMIRVDGAMVEEFIQSLWKSSYKVLMVE